MEALYKMRKPKTGQADRSIRAKIKGTASKSSRADLQDSKRRIPLSEVQPSNNQMPCKLHVILKVERLTCSKLNIEIRLPARVC